ncbi:FecR domain-containing protein [Terrimonas sp. NA20]|uniref:FecR domain-containing protein n=1 Tax=Terrimonas ginsenosidimutans TaxID=2908004 RepID=A0ABS9KSZ8_9BACT|nr:FecR domain-containing protein [Terrimonas ginsenosidimutans]MCG2615456.1 FecR domain-containing protein [Terrimonas ginsenosidimutans]
MKVISEDEIAVLLVLYIQEKISPEQREILVSWKNSSPANLHQFEQLTDPVVLRRKLKLYSEVVAGEGEVVKEPSRVISMIRKKWFSYAAAVVVLISLAVFFKPWPGKKIEKLSTTTTEGSNQKLQATNSAVLVLADGSTILLDSAVNGQLTHQEGVQVLKTGDGQIKYQSSKDNIPAANAGVNTIRTPRGRQYQLSLPDGSQVWLNAASSITFPPVFDSKTRKITVQGEVYLEVAKDTRRPFLVNVNDKETVEVLGTHFNINAYEDEPYIRTTLIEGSVKVARGELTSLLKPGEQAMVNAKGALQKSADVNIEQVIAWTKGKLAINSADFQGLMRQISRWYDVDVVFAGQMPDLRVGGFIRRDVNVSTVLDFLKGNGVKYEFDGKTITIL